MKESTISLLALVALFLLKVVLADELSLPFHMPINETFDLEVFQGNALVGVYSYPRCGRQGGGEKCIKPEECCSIWGWCGTTLAYCAPGNCQSQCVKPSPPPPSPPPPPPPPPPSSPPPPPPSPPPPPPSPPPPPPSAYPRCGRQGGGGKCIKTGECCSIWGWCGTTSAYCAPGNCQSQCKSTLTSSANNRMRGIESF